MSMDQLMALVPIEAATAKKKRKTRWERVDTRQGTSRFGRIDDKPYLPPPFVDLPCGLTPGQVDQFFREQRYHELSKKLADGELEFGDDDIRPPSPPPMYDKMGSRTNTREIRTKTAMTDEHQRLTEYMILTVPSFLPPADFKPSKKQRRIVIPLEQYPEYNFMGLIIGPRGCNHKRLEAESGAQISIRGKGTQKDGKRDHQTEEESQMPMHVHIVADTEEMLEKAVNLVEPLLDPFHPMHEEFKKRGLTQLALVNGVNYSALDQQRCAVCGAVGHLASECQDAKELQPFKKADVRCAICGDKGHVTMDCRLANQRGGNPPSAPPPPSAPAPGEPGKSPYQLYMDKVKMDQEYQKMMNELSGGTSNLESLDGDFNQRSTTPGAGGMAGANATPPPGVSPTVPGMVSTTGIPPYPRAPPPPPTMSNQRAVASPPLGGSMYNHPIPGQTARPVGTLGSQPPPPPTQMLGQWTQPYLQSPGAPVVAPAMPVAGRPMAMQGRMLIQGQPPPLYTEPPVPGTTGYPVMMNTSPMGMTAPTNGFPGQILQPQMAGYQTLPTMAAFPTGLVSMPLPPAMSTNLVGNIGTSTDGVVKSEGAAGLFMAPTGNSAPLSPDNDMDSMDTSN